MKKNNHIDNKGNVQMVDIADKKVTKRKAISSGFINTSKETITSIKENTNKKGDVFSVAKIAGIQAAKKTSELIPLAHPIDISNVKINFEIINKTNQIECVSEVTSVGKTGVEIESLMATQISLLTIYDMCKYLDKAMLISDIKLIQKTGGKSGDYKYKK
ncbi:MAG: cyclic pyranopterin monophosphate synthase MoaC [Pseudomonadota bacterium]|nr:cyclic pyranopterin monophosphate synthase MoaC [Pseudomonadota bacterium]|tara:strand:+ start:192 stop:671 length:480 start_codon:yes stop_codon:yes gene_type:complete